VVIERRKVLLAVECKWRSERLDIAPAITFLSRLV